LRGWDGPARSLPKQEERPLKKLVWCVAALALVTSATAPRAVAQGGADTSTASASSEQDVQGRLDGMVEQVQTLVADVDKLKKFKFSGYVQARWETAENQSDTVRVSGSPPTITPANQARFYIRRGRLKLTYDSSPLSQAVVYIDGGTDRTIRLLEAYVTLLDPWTVLHQHALTVGQFNVPFGYEIERSSSVREFPERSRAENVLFPGERDRGVKLVNAWTPQFETAVSVLNGGGVNHPDFPNTDPTSRKDLTGRARFSQGTIDGAISYYLGRNIVPLTGPDVELDKTRLGFDSQLYYELPTLGGGSLKGEAYIGKNTNADSVAALTITSATAPVRQLRPGADIGTDFSGWYAMAVQNLGDKLQAAARWESFDPNTDVDHDQFERLSLALHWFYDGFTRITASYDVPRTDRAVTGGGYEDPPDNLWTVQFQHRF
jgi:hypothetical protein